MGIKISPKISVILPFYNAEQTLARAVKSILNQSFEEFELLLVDNNSTDSSRQIAEKACSDDTRIQLLEENKIGVAHAMNTGLAYAKGSFLARMDADDEAQPGRLAHQLAFLDRNPGIDAVGSEVRYVQQNPNTEGFERFVDWANSFHTPEEINLNRFVEIPIVNPTLFFRRELYDNLGGCLDGDFPEDYEMQLRYLQSGAQMARLDKVLLDWYDYSTRLTRTDRRYSSEAFFRIKAKYFLKWSEENNPHHPRIWIWGAGRKTRQRSEWLKKEGLQVMGRIDVVQTKPDAIYYEDVPDPGSMFIVSMVTNPGAGLQIREFLKTRMYLEGKDFILMG